MSLSSSLFTMIFPCVSWFSIIAIDFAFAINFAIIFNPFFDLTFFLEKNNFIVFGLYQRWFRRPTKDFCEKSLSRGDMVMFFSNSGETWYKYLLFMFFSKHTDLCCGKIPHSKGITPYLGISEIWSIQLLLFDFGIMQWWRHHQVIFYYEKR